MASAGSCASRERPLTGPETRETARVVKAFDEQAGFAKMIEATVLQSTANMIDFVEADSLAAMASDAVAA